MTEEKAVAEKQQKQPQIVPSVDSATAEEGAGLPAELLVKHPLQSRWVLWYLKADRNKEWEDCLKGVATFDKVEDFWALYNHIQVASGLVWGSDYYVFKEGIKPMWEDENNVKGGRWLLQLQVGSRQGRPGTAAANGGGNYHHHPGAKTGSAATANGARSGEVERQKRAEQLDQYWLELLMAMVGEQFEDLGEYICGAVVNVRQKGDKISLWTQDATKDNVNQRIGQIMKGKLGIPDSETIKYEVHKDLSVKTGSSVKARLTIPKIPATTPTTGGAAGAAVPPPSVAK